MPAKGRAPCVGVGGCDLLTHMRIDSGAACCLQGNMQTATSQLRSLPKCLQGLQMASVFVMNTFHIVVTILQAR